VHHLYQHLTTRAVIADSKARVMGSMQQTRESTTTVSTSRAGRTSVADTISHTIAKLLSFIPDDSLYPCIIFDLVHLLVDLSVVAQTGLLLDDQQTSRHKNDKGATNIKTKKKRKKLQVQILSDTVGQSPLAADHNDKTEAVFVLDITSINVLSSLQAATFSILQQFLMDLQLRRIQPLPVTMMVDPAMCNRPPVEGAEPSKAPLFQPLGNVDLLFYGILEDGELLFMLLLALRQVLQSSAVCRSGTRTQQHPLLCLYSKITSAQLLTKLVQDFHKDRVPTLTTATEVAILICNAVKIFLQDDISVTGTATISITGLSPSDVSSYEKMSHEYLQLLATLVRDSILFPPNVHGTSSVAEVLWTMRSATFSTLLDCLALIAEKVDTPGTGTFRNGQDSNSDRDPLYAIILQAVHTFRSTPPPQQGTAMKLNSAAAESMIWTYCASHGISRHLFIILQQHATLAEPIVGLLSWLLDPFYYPTSSMAPMMDWNNACLQALDQHHQHTNNGSASSSTLVEGRTSTSTIVPPPPPTTNILIMNEDIVDVSSDMEVTPKVVGETGVKRKKKASVSPRKKKGSLFQPKSLTFEESSPLKKRRRSSVPAATASSLHQAETGLGLLGAPIVWQDALRDFLVAALNASNRLKDSFLKPSAETFVDERATGPATPELRDESTTDTNMTLNGIRLLLSMLQHRCTGANIHRDDVDLEAPLKVLYSLSRRLQTCCEAIEAGILENGSLASLQQCVCDAAITCGLHAQFTVEVSLRRWTSNTAAQLRKTFDYFSGLGARLCMTKLLSTQHSSKPKVPSSIPSTRSCSNLCTRVNSAFSILADHRSSDRSSERSRHSWMRPFIFPDGLGEPSEWSTNFNRLATQARNCYSMSIISTLPLRTRCVVSCTTGFLQYQCSLFSL
jgi:hypothetical protein